MGDYDYKNALVMLQDRVDRIEVLLEDKDANLPEIMFVLGQVTGMLDTVVRRNEAPPNMDMFDE